MGKVSQWITGNLIFAGLCFAQSPLPRAADIPQPKSDASWIRRAGEQQHALTNQRGDVCFIGDSLGDSLTEYWLDTGRQTWDLEFAPLKSINLGLAADRTENVLNRIGRLEFYRAAPKVIVLLMGTNNLGMMPPDRPEDVVKAVQKAEVMLRAKVPAAHLIVLGIPPNGYEAGGMLRDSIKKTNELLKQVVWTGNVTFIPVYDSFVDEQDRWRTGLTLDGTHFTAEGYKVLGSLIAAPIDELLKKVR